MRLLASTALLGLAWFAAINVLAGGVAWMLSRTILRSGRSSAAAVLLRVRLLPAGLATLFVAGVFLPAHLRYEPAESDERFGVVLIALGTLGLIAIARSAWRLTTVAAADRQIRRWVLTPMGAAGRGAYEVSGFRGISLAGILRTRILVGSAVRAALTPDELDAALAHERAHRHSRDNLKRCLLFCAPDLFGWSRTAAKLEAGWRAQAEREADRNAVAGDEHRAMHLASALVKVARLGGTGRAVPSPMWSTFNEPPLLESRVRALVLDRARPSSGGQVRQAAAGAAGAAVFVWLAAASHGVHRLTEALVAWLP